MNKTPRIITKDDLIEENIRKKREEDRKNEMEKLKANPVYQNDYVSKITDLFYELGDQIAIINEHIEITHKEMFKLNEKDAGNKEFFDEKRRTIELLQGQKSDLEHIFNNKIDEIKAEYIRDIRISMTPQVEDLPIIRALQDIALDDNQLIGYIEQYKDNEAILSSIKKHLIKEKKLDLLKETDVKIFSVDDKIASINMLCKQFREAAEDSEMYISRLINKDIDRYISSFSELV